MYIRTVNFSNKRLKIFYRWIPIYINDVQTEKEKLYSVFEKLKVKISRPYNKALIRASILNELRYNIISSLKNVDCCDRTSFMKLYNIKPVCEGCKVEPIQEEAHIIMSCKGKKIRELNNYLNHYANLWLLCGTCHRIVDGRGGNVSKRREMMTIKNLRSRIKIQKRVYEDLKVDRKRLSSEKKGIEKLLKYSNEKAVSEIKTILRKYKIK